MFDCVTDVLDERSRIGEIGDGDDLYTYRLRGWARITTTLRGHHGTFFIMHPLNLIE